MEISAKKTKLMRNNTSGINTEIKVNEQKLQTVTSFKYLGSVITDEGFKPEIQITAALTKLKPVWNDRSISLSSKIGLMRSLVASILQRRIQAMEIRCYLNILLIIIIIINPLTARVVGAPQMILQPVFSIFPVLHCPLGLAELQACPFPDLVFPPLPLSALSSSPFHCALQDGFGQT